jgi:hypothetical protein
MKEWDVYINGKWVGTVVESTETFARCAALVKYDIGADDELEVSQR